MAASAAKTVAVELGRLLVEEAKFLYGVEDKVEELHQELAWMQGFLQDVDTRQHKEELIRMWVAQVRHLAYEAQDIIEKYIHQVSNTEEKEDSVLWDFVNRFFNLVVNAPTIHEVGSNIDKLTQKILRINTRLVSYGVKIRHVDSSRIRDLRHTYPVATDKHLIKREADIENGVKKLLCAQNKIVGVVGMGGLGKTTLAREVYGNAVIKEKFDCFAWVYVSQQPQKRLVLEEIYRALLGLDATTMDVRSMSEEQLCVEVDRIFRHQACLVVLDDIWYKETWHLLKHAFSSIIDSSTSASKLLLTTQNEEVVSHVDPGAIILKPTPLNDEESWELLCMKAIAQYDDAQIDPAMKEAGERMLKHCGGLPIAIIALGGILATRNKVDEWKAVEERVGVYLFNKSITEMELIQVLELSYNDLPFHLKPCFLCLGNYPRDTEIHTDALFQLWQAEGLVEAPDENGLNIGVYETAEQYLNELVKRCMVEVGRVYKNGRIKTCRMHDVMRELSWNKSREQKFLEVCEMKRDTNELVWRCHRVVVHVEVNEQSENLFSGLGEHSVKPRSAFVYMPLSYNDNQVRMWLSKMSQAFALLRILRFERVMVTELPNELGNCIHLKYLRLGFDQEFNEWSVVWKLTYLQTLDLRDSKGILLIPNQLWKLKRLVHLYLPSAYKAQNDEKLRLCEPRKMETLLNIRLETFDLDALLKMGNLRLVSFGGNKPIGLTHLKAVLDSMITSKLLSNPILDLKIDAAVINDDLFILGSNPHADILWLTIGGMIRHSLDCIIIPRTVSHLSLYDSNIDGSCISLLIIPELKTLKFGKNAIKGNTIVLSSLSCPRLYKLDLHWEPNISEAIIVEGDLPEECELNIRCRTNSACTILSALHRLDISRREGNSGHTGASYDTRFLFSSPHEWYSGHIVASPDQGNSGHMVASPDHYMVSVESAPPVMYGKNTERMGGSPETRGESTADPIMDENKTLYFQCVGRWRDIKCKFSSLHGYVPQT